jgi:hypothetical protein
MSDLVGFYFSIIGKEGKQGRGGENTFPPLFPSPPLPLCLSAFHVS